MITKIEAPPGYWRVSTVAVVLNVSSSTVRRWLRDKRIEGCQKFGVYLIPEAEIERFVISYRPGQIPLTWVEKTLLDIFPTGKLPPTWLEEVMHDIFPDGIDLQRTA